MSLTGSCLRGQIAFEVDGDLPEKLTRCTCSFCSKRGTLCLYVAPEHFRRIAPERRTPTHIGPPQNPTDAGDDVLPGATWKVVRSVVSRDFGLNAGHSVSRHWKVQRPSPSG